MSVVTIAEAQQDIMSLLKDIMKVETPTYIEGSKNDAVLISEEEYFTLLFLLLSTEGIVISNDIMAAYSRFISDKNYMEKIQVSNASEILDKLVSEVNHTNTRFTIECGPESDRKAIVLLSNEDYVCLVEFQALVVEKMSKNRSSNVKVSGSDLIDILSNIKL